MNIATLVLWCLTYIVGLLVAGWPWAVPVPGGARDLPLGAIALLLLGAIAAVAIPRFWRTGPKPGTWFAAGLVGMIAVFHYHLSLPTPSSTDISHLLPQGNGSGTTIVVTGEIASSPKLTRSQRIQFDLQVQHLGSPEQATLAPATVSGKVYATVPLLQGTELHPSQQVTIRGQLYRPPRATQPGDFDFARYLQRQGMFAGLTGSDVTPQSVDSRLPCVSWSHCLALIRQRIVRSHVQGASVPAGTLISAMAMGRRGVDLDFALRDQFAQVGLAHALAASGFHVSLLLGVVMALTRACSPGRKCVIGSLVLLGYIVLTGAQPSILRAGLMGFTALLAMAWERKVIALRLLLVVAVVLLIAQPLWINDLGFQFSFLATLGLMVTVPALTRYLDWLPGTLIPLVAVPMSAFLWTMPLQLFSFGTISPYTVLVNLLATPLVAVVCIGGIASGVAALAMPPLGIGMAWIVGFPATWLIWLVDLTSRLPGSRVSVGAIALWQVVCIYGLFILLWWKPRWHPRWWIVGLLSFSLAMIPGWFAHQGIHVTILAAGSDPITIVQDHGDVGIIGMGDETSVHYTLLPFLQRQGINRIDWAIATNLDGFHCDGWGRLLQELTVREFYSPVELGDGGDEEELGDGGDEHHRLLREALVRRHSQVMRLMAGASVVKHHVQITPWMTEPMAVLVQIGGNSESDEPVRWLFVEHPDRLDAENLDQMAAQNFPHDLPINLFWWAGSSPSSALLNRVNPLMAIAPPQHLSQTAQTWLQEHHRPWFTQTVSWRPRSQFQANAIPHPDA